jgi:hypothetical protein
MSDKKIPLYLGEGPDRIQIGRAEVEHKADGTMIVNASIDNPDWGRWAVGGYEPLRLLGVVPSRNPLIRQLDLYSVGPAESGLGTMEAG